MKKYLHVVFVLLFATIVMGEYNVSYISVCPLGGISFLYYKPIDLKLASLGQFGATLNTIWFDRINLHYNNTIHADFLLENSISDNPYYTHDINLSYHIPIDGAYRIAPCVLYSIRSLSSDTILSGARYGVNNIFYFVDEGIINLIPFIGYHDNSTFWGIHTVTSFGGSWGTVLQFIINYEHSNTYNYFAANFSIGLPLKFIP